MERAEAESDEATRFKSAIRCAKAAILLSSLKSSLNRDLRASIGEQSKVDLDYDSAIAIATALETEKLRKAVGDLKIELAMERMRNKRIMLCGLMEFVLQFLLVIFLSSFFIFIAFNKL